jgi:hypothetical protein
MAFQYRMEKGAARLGGADDVHTLIVDWTIEEGNTVTVLATAGNEASLYYSTGGGVFGAGSHESVRVEIQKVLETAVRSRHLLAAKPLDENLPQGETMRFTLVTDDGYLIAEDTVEALSSQRSELSELGNAVQFLLASIRALEP